MNQGDWHEVAQVDGVYSRGFFRRSHAVRTADPNTREPTSIFYNPRSTIVRATAGTGAGSAKGLATTDETQAWPTRGFHQLARPGGGLNWFQGKTGNIDYGFFDSLLRVGIGQTGERIDWFIEGEQPSILGLPNNAVVWLLKASLAWEETYYAANNNHTNTANGFLKQGFVNFKHLGPAGLKLGRFEYFDGAEVKPTDPLLANGDPDADYEPPDLELRLYRSAAEPTTAPRFLLNSPAEQT